MEKPASVAPEDKALDLSQLQVSKPQSTPPSEKITPRAGTSDPEAEEHASKAKEQQQHES